MMNQLLETVVMKSLVVEIKMMRVFGDDESTVGDNGNMSGVGDKGNISSVGDNGDVDELGVGDNGNDESGVGDIYVCSHFTYFCINIC